MTSEHKYTEFLREQRAAIDKELADIEQAHPGPPVYSSDFRLLTETQPSEDAYGTRYEPFTDGWAVGFKVTPPDGVVQWIYLNPSSTDEGSEAPQSNLFLYHDEGDQPHFMGALSHLVTYEVPKENA